MLEIHDAESLGTHNPADDEEDEDEVVLLDVRPIAAAEDGDVVMVDGLAFEQRKKPASKATRRPRTTASRTCPYNRFVPHPTTPASRKKLKKWDVFAEEWPQIDEALEQRPELRGRLASVRGYIEILEQDPDFKLWRDPFLEQWGLLRELVGTTDERNVVEWAEGMLVDVFNS